MMEISGSEGLRGMWIPRHRFRRRSGQPLPLPLSLPVCGIALISGLASGLTAGLDRQVPVPP